MLASLLLVSLLTLSGTVATYLYDNNASFQARLCSGACVGLAAMGLVAFVFASLLGLTSAAILLALVVCLIPLSLLTRTQYRTAFSNDWSRMSISTRSFFMKPSAGSFGYFIFYLVVVVTFLQVFNRTMIVDDEGISTGLLNNFGDLPFHLSVITGFAYGNNFPPDDPTYAGVRFTYPFLTDFISAIFVRCGADLRQSMFLENFTLAISFVGLLHRWALVMLKDRLAAILTPLLVLLNGGLGWTLLLKHARENELGLLGVFNDLPPSFTVIPETTWRWGNAISSLLVPQRGFLMGLPLAVLVFTQWWLATDDKGGGPKESLDPQAGSSKKATASRKVTLPRSTITVTPVYRMVGAGVAAGLLPLVHAHSFVVVMVMSACLALLQWRWRAWITFIVTASLIAIPQLLWSTSHSAVNAGSFFAIELGWDHGQENPMWFWAKNTGFFIPLLVAALLMRGEEYVVNKRLLIFYLPFVLCFVVPNFLKMAPWIWDNIKVLFYWWLASAPIVALLLARLWRKAPAFRVLAAALFGAVTLSGALDVAAITLRSNKYGIYNVGGMQFADVIRQTTDPRALIVHAPVHNDPVFLTGRRSLMGYPGHIWTHGLEFVQRESEIKHIYAGAIDADALLRRYDVDYVVIGPLERLVMPVNEPFFKRYTKVTEVGEYSLYKIKP